MSNTPNKKLKFDISREMNATKKERESVPVDYLKV